MVRKEFIQMRRDRLTLGMMIGLPAIQLALFGYAIRTEVRHLPTVIMEAMATGLPVVSTNIGGIPEMVVENETGFLVQPGDGVAMAEAINKIIGDASAAERLGQSGYARAQRLFSIDKNVRELCALIS